MIGKAIFNRTPLLPNRLTPLPLGAVKPEGWMREQLEEPARARLEQVLQAMPDIGARSAWFGGGGDDSEKSCLFFDAYVLLAWTLDDADMQKEALGCIEYLVAHQREDGSFGPMSNPDVWPRMVIMRAMIQAFTATADKRILVFLDKYLRYQLRTLQDKPLIGVDVARSGENILAALWLYNLTGQEYLLLLVKILREQSLDWTNEYHIFPHIRAMAKQRPHSEMRAGCAREHGLIGAQQPPYCRDNQLSDAINHAISIKTPGMVNHVKSGFKELKAFEIGWQRLMKYHGAAGGMFTGDTHLAGNSPQAGVSLRAVMEAIRSLEVLLGMQDDVFMTASDAIEKIAFNAMASMLPGSKPVFESLSQTNQVLVTDAPRGWYDLGDDATLFGVGAGDALATLSGLKDFASLLHAAWYVTADDGLAAVSYVPCAVNYVAGGTRVRLLVETNYPFESDIKIHTQVKSPCEFPLYLRVPAWTEQAILHLPDGEIMQLRGGETVCVRRRWSGAETLAMHLPMTPKLVRGYHHSASVELGPLVMCYRPKEEWTALADGRWSVATKEKWNWALLDDQPMKSVFEETASGAFAERAARVALLVKAAPCDGWDIVEHSAAQPPIEPEIPAGGAETIRLTPYGASALRIAQFPVAKIAPDASNKGS